MFNCCHQIKKDDERKIIDFRKTLIEWDSLYQYHPSNEGDSILSGYLFHALETNNKEAVGNIYRRIGNQWFRLGHPKAAIDSLLKGLHYSEEAHDTEGVFSTENCIGDIYDSEGQFQRGLLYHLKSLEIYDLIKFNYGSADISLSIGRSYLARGIMDSALFYGKKALKYKLECKEKDYIQNYELFLSKLYLARGRLDSSAYWLDMAKDEKIVDDATQSNILLIETELYYLKGNMQNASSCLSHVSHFINKVIDVNERLATLKKISESWVKIPNLDSALFYMRCFLTLKDSVQNENNIFYITQANRLYDKSKVERVNEELKSQNKFKKILLISLTIFLILIIGLCFYIFKNQQNKRKKILAENNLNINKILEEVNQTKMEAWADGQEKERSRLAAELHDRLGGLLVMASHHFTGIEKKFNIIQQENESAFSDFRKIINNAIIEVRELSKDISSNLVSKLGLANAMMDLKEKIENATTLKVHLSIHDAEAKASLPMEIALFRIAQEALNNIMKHAQATDVQLSLTGNDQSLVLIVEDNGKGFDSLKMPDFAGMGLKSMQKRMLDIGGSLHIDSKPGRGTIVVAEILLSKE